MTALTWNAFSPLAPPAAIRAEARAPSENDQKIRWIFGGSGSPLAAMQSMTSDPESADVTNNSTIAKSEKMARKFPITATEKKLLSIT